MLAPLPRDDVLYDALMARDATYEGRALVGVRSTGIFCRLICPARKPKRENCSFYPDAAASLSAGFRPCKRCHPMGQLDPLAQQLLELLQADPQRRWQESDLAEHGIDPSTARRTFKRAFGLSFVEMARQRRLGASMLALPGG